MTTTTAAGHEGWIGRIDELLGRLGQTSPPFVERAVAYELRAVSEPGERGVITSLLTRRLHDAVTQAWRQGWQPADLERVVRRDHREPVQLVLAAAIRRELDTYPRSTVDPRWWDQVAELPTGPRRRSGRKQPDPVADWLRGCQDLVLALQLVRRLPQLPVLGPLPGQAQHRDPDAAVDDKLLTKVRRLLAQAEGTPYEAEAETFTAAAQSLMARHQIDRAMLDATDESVPRLPEAVRLSVERPYDGPKMQLLHQICLANRCRTVWSQDGGFATVIGYAADRRAVELLFTSLLVQATTAMQREGEESGQTSRGFRSSFLLGFAVRIGQRLVEAGRAEEAAARVRLAAAPESTSASPEQQPGDDRLALVLHAREAEVDERVAELFPLLERSRRRQVSDGRGFAQGTAAADRAHLGAGARLPGRAS